MNSLCEAILKDIDNINNECYDAQNAVTEAAIELEEKYVEMAYVSNKFVQEGKFIDFMEYSPDEKVIKTILLAIPRIIIGLINQLRTKWKHYSIKRKCEDIRDKIDKADELAQEFYAIAGEIDNVFTNPPKNIQLGLNANGEIAYHLRSKILSLDVVNDYYNKTKKLFNDYANAIKDDNSEDLLSGYADMNKYGKALMETGLDMNGYGRVYDMTIGSPDYNELIKLTQFQQYHATVLDDIDKSMKEVAKWVNQTLQSTKGKTSGMTKDMAKQLLADSRKVHDEFLKADSSVMYAILETLTDWNNGVTWSINKLNEKAELIKKAEAKGNEATDYDEKLEKEEPIYKTYKDLRMQGINPLEDEDY